jgi:hypothetical protein
VGVLAIVGAACGAGSSSSSSPPSDHGGYGGRQAKLFDAAYRRCYRSARPVSGGQTEEPYKLLPEMDGTNVTLPDLQAFTDGCNAALKATEVPIIEESATIIGGSGP